MRILILGNDGRAHAYAWHMLTRSLASEVICAPGNGGTAPLAATADLDPQQTMEIARWCFDEQIDLVIPSSSAPLLNGLTDEAISLQGGVCGPAQRTATLEQSRCQIKEFALRYGIPTAPGRSCTDLATAERFLATQPLPVMIKANHPSGGEQIYHDRYSALEGLRTFFVNRPLESQRPGVVIEAVLNGPRVVLSALTDGETVLPLLAARLYDQAEPNGPVAAGVGAQTGISTFARQLTEFLQRKFLTPIVAGLAAEQLPCWGVIGIDCIITADGPRLTSIRFSLREGEAQVVLPRLEDDLAPYLQATITRRLGAMPALRWSPTYSVGLGIFARGYPISFPYGSLIHGLDELDEGILLFHSSTANPSAIVRYTPKQRGGIDRMIDQVLGINRGGSNSLHSTGGLVATIVAQGATLAGARGRAQINAGRIRFDAATFREDIAAKEFA
ncbi:MAG: phosphoribosylglycinamide synthetase C domain-containing protein [Roseiflexaceae bacterium]